MLSPDVRIDKEGAPPVGGPRITDARVFDDAGLQNRFDAGDVISLVFSEPMNATSASAGQAFEITDGDGDVFQIICATNAACTLQAAHDDLAANQELRISVGALMDGNAGGDGILTIPGTISTVSAGLDAVLGAQLDLAGSPDRAVDVEP